MKKLLIILFFIPLLLSAQTIIYQTGFETGFDGWRPNGNAGSYRILTIPAAYYGITPVGSYMANFSQVYGYCNRPLQLKAGRTYNFSFKYNNSYSGRVDTTFIAADTLQTNSVPLAGCTKVHLTTVKPGTLDQNWHVVNFSVTPAANGGYWHISSGNGYSEIMIDSMTVTGDTSNYVFQFKTPANLTLYNPGDTVKYSWHATRYDSTFISTPTGNIKVYNDSVYNYIAPDTVLQFSSIGYSYQNNTKRDTVTLLFTKNKYLYIDSVKSVVGGIYVRVVSKNVDSLKYYYKTNGSFTYFAHKIVDKTLSPNVTTLTYNLIGQGSVSIKVVEDRDTSRIIKQLTSCNSVGSLYDGRICYYQGSTNAFETPWVLDVSCGWSSGIYGTPGITSLIWNDRAIYHSLTATPCADRCCHGMNGSAMYIAGQGLVTEGGDPRFEDGSGIKAVSYCPQALNTLTYDGWSYYTFSFVQNNVNKCYLMASDLLNNVTSMDYLDITDLVYPTNQWVAPLFTSGNFNFGAYLYPYTDIWNQAHSLHPNSYTATFKSGCSPDVNVNVPTISQAEIAATVLPRNFTPQLILQDTGGWNAAISVPLLKHRDLSPLLFDTWGYNIDTKVRDYFRGVDPRIHRGQ